MAIEGSKTSSILSLPRLANQILNGSAFLEGIDSIILNILAIVATSVIRIFPSWAFIFNRTIFSYTSLPSTESFIFKSDQYLLGDLLSVKALTTSITLI